MPDFFSFLCSKHGTWHRVINKYLFVQQPPLLKLLYQMEEHKADPWPQPKAQRRIRSKNYKMC